MKPTVDIKRTVKLTPVVYDSGEWMDYGEPGRAEARLAGRLVFNCPGCGRGGSISIGDQKPPETPSWQITAGSVADLTSITLAPSIRCVGCCGWHGYLTNGVFASC